MELGAYLVLIASFIPSFLIHECSSLTKVDIIVPEYVLRGRDVQLTCKYDLKISELYAIKWYKGAQEFYRFVPKETPVKKSFSLPGIQVKMSESDEHSVFLRNVSLDVSGSFKCVVSAEFTFQTLDASAYLNVIVIGEDKPSLDVERRQYHPGDSIQAHCLAPPSFPPANITWYLDGNKINESWKTDHSIQIGREELGRSTKSVIKFYLNANTTKNVLRLRCYARVFSAYGKFDEEPIPVSQREFPGPSKLLPSAGSTVSAPFFIIIVTCAQIFCSLILGTLSKCTSVGTF